MRYLGGKTALGKHLVPHILATDPDCVIEPFLGGASFMSHIFKAGYEGRYIAGDFDPDASYLWKMVAEEGWLPPVDLPPPSREEWEAMRDSPWAPDPIRGMARCGVTFGGIPWRSYSQPTPEVLATKPAGYDIWGATIRSIRKDAKVLAGKDITIHGGDYKGYGQFLTPSSVVYCDPPYEGTAGYGHAFDHEEFWDTVREWSLVCPVYVSELHAPEDFVAIFERDLRNNLRSKKGHQSERLFVHRSRA